MGIASTETVLFVRDLEHAVRFYTQQMGLPLRQEADWGYARLGLGEHLSLGLISESSWAREYPDDENLPKPRVALVTTDVPAELERLKAAGVHFGPVRDLDGGGKAVVFWDPDGNPFLLWNPPA